MFLLIFCAYIFTNLKTWNSGHYPEEAPEWWRQRHSHDNMWKYGVWAQRSTLALPEHERAKYARHVHIMDSWETQDEPAPMRTH